MEVKLTRLTQLYLVAQTSTIYSSRSGRPVRKLLDTHPYVLPLESVTQVSHPYKTRGKIMVTWAINQ